jgi:hypothetical protein
VQTIHALFVRSWRASLLACAFAITTISTVRAEEAAEAPTHTDFDWWALENRAYYDPLLAEPRAAQITAVIFAQSSKFDYMQTDGRHQMWDISLGKEIPLFGAENCVTANGPIQKGCTGFGLWLPVSFHMVEDFEDDSSPIINTDYRFSLLAKAQWGLSKNRSISARVQVGHESTHVGDEFTIHALQDYGDAFERVNVSYEYWEYGFSYKRWSANEKSLWTFRHGGIGLLNNKKGFYGASLLTDDPENPEPSLTRSNKNFEPMFGVEWEMPDTPISQKWFFKNWAPIASVDARLKTVYNYHRVPESASDKQALSVSAVFGLKHVNQTYNQRGVPILIARAYYGVNPNGQFRNQNKYFQWGFGLIVPL